MLQQEPKINHPLPDQHHQPFDSHRQEPQDQGPKRTKINDSKRQENEPARVRVRMKSGGLSRDTQRGEKEEVTSSEPPGKRGSHPHKSKKVPRHPRGVIKMIDPTHLTYQNDKFHAYNTKNQNDKIPHIIHQSK